MWNRRGINKESIFKIHIKKFEGNQKELLRK